MTVFVAALGAATIAPLTSSTASGSSGGSGSTGDLSARAAAISTEIARDGRQLQAIGERYLADESRLLAARTRQHADLVSERRLAARIAHDQRRVRQAAVQAYVDADADNALGLFIEERPNDVALGQAYLSEVTGQLGKAIDSLSFDRSRYARDYRDASAAAARAAAALQSAHLARSGALSTLASEQRLLASTRGRLAALIAAQAAARARAAQLAAEQAAAAAAKRAAVVAASERHAGRHGFRPGAGPPALLVAPVPRETSSSPASVIPPSLAAAFAGIRNCEAGGNYAEDTGNGYYGAYQFSLSTWWGLGESGLPSDAPPAVQDAAAYRLYLSSGWGSWPACSAILGL